MDIAHELRLWKDVRARLRAAYPDEDDATLFDTLDGECTLADRLRHLVREIEEAEIRIPGIQERIGELKERAERYERRAEKLRGIVLYAMQEAGIPKLEAPTFTASPRPVQPRVVITDEAALPPGFLRTRTEPNKTAIGDALRAGRQVPGAMLGNASSTLSIRRS